ncbi:hypothetical protein D3C85_289630 [compost metagenome]
MNFLLKVVAAYQAVRLVVELCHEAKHQTAEPTVPQTVTIIPNRDSGHLTAVKKENTSDVNKVGVSACAGSIPVTAVSGFIPTTAEEGDTFRKSTGRIGVEEDCSTGSPAMEQRHRKKKRRSPKKRANLREEVPRFTIVEPTLVSVEIV